MSIVIAGLGNPGKEYGKTRHNAGRLAVEKIAKENGFDDFVFNKKANALVVEGKIGKEKVTLLLPETMVNASGKAISAFVKTPAAGKRLLVIHDDLDLPIGALKMVFDRGSGGHKGVESINRALKTEAYARIRIGISGQGRKNQAKKVSGEEKVLKHVIGKFSPKEEGEMKKIMKKIVAAAGLFATEGLEKAQQEANTRA